MARTAYASYRAGVHAVDFYLFIRYACDRNKVNDSECTIYVHTGRRWEYYTWRQYLFIFFNLRCDFTLQASQGKVKSVFTCRTLHPVRNLVLHYCNAITRTLLHTVKRFTIHVVTFNSKKHPGYVFYVLKPNVYTTRNPTYVVCNTGIIYHKDVITCVMYTPVEVLLHGVGSYNS